MGSDFIALNCKVSPGIVYINRRLVSAVYEDDNGDTRVDLMDGSTYFQVLESPGAVMEAIYRKELNHD